jgi:hypothetical protein
MFTTNDRAIIDFERCSPIMFGPKDWNIEQVLGLSAGRYYDRLLELLGDAEAVDYDPLTLRRVGAMIERVVAVEATG